MKKGHIYIKGQIGNTLDEKGEIAVKGVELEDVVTQVESQKDSESFDVHIDSRGGIVEVGMAIATYLGSLDQELNTIGENIVGSIATVIHLVPPVANRKLIKGTDYFIHNPLVENVSGDSSKLKAAAEYVEQYEKDLLAVYTKNVTADKDALKGLMKMETSLDEDQAVTLGFVGEIIEKIELSAVAMMGRKAAKPLNKNTPIINFDQNAFFQKISAMVKAALPEKQEVKAGEHSTVSTDKGDLEFLSTGDLPEVGEEVTMNGEAVSEGDYTLTDGTVIKVDAESKVAEIVPFEETDEEVEALKAENNRLKAEIVETNKAIKATIEEEIKKIKESYGSEFIPVAEVPGFREKKKIANKVSDIKEEAAERRAEYSTK